jgi:hypothetical protein
MTREEVTEIAEAKANSVDVYQKTETYTKSEVDSTVAPKADQQYVDNALTGFTNGAAKFYPTIAAAQADIANISVKDKVEVGEAEFGGVWYKATAGSTSLTKSAYDPLTQAKGYADSLVKSKNLGNSDLNTIVAEGDYFQTASANATAANNYPVHAQATQSKISVLKQNTVLIHIIEARGVVSTRVSFDNGSNWAAWNTGVGQTDLTAINTNLARIESQFKKPLHFSVSGSFGSVNYNKNTKVLSWATPLIATTQNAATSRISIAASSVTLSGSAFETLYLDLNNVPADGNVTSTNMATCLKLGKYSDAGVDAFKEKINQVPLVQVTPQGNVVACAGMLFDVIAESPKVDGFRYTKTAAALAVFLPAKNGNLIKFNIPHETIAFDAENPRSQLDLWRIERAIEVDPALTELQEIATWGEIEFTMREKAYPADHVGGTHGDEKLTNAFFVVDGVYKTQDFTVVGTQVAKEIRLEQTSNIFRLNTQTPIALHKKHLKITENWIVAQQEIEMLVTTDVDRFWTAMLTMRRKSVDELIQISKYDIRDGVMRNVSTTEFEKTYTPTKKDSPVIVCGDKYSGSVELLEMSGFLTGADIYVANDVAYNKIYVSAIGGASSGVTLPAGTKISWTAKYKVDAI